MRTRQFPCTKWPQAGRPRLLDLRGRSPEPPGRQLGAQRSDTGHLEAILWTQTGESSERADATFIPLTSGPPEGPAGAPGRTSAQGGGNFAATCGSCGSGARQNMGPAAIGRATLPLFATLAAPGPRKPAFTSEQEANRTGFRVKRHGSVRYFRIEGLCFRRFPGRSGDFPREARKTLTQPTRF